LSAGRRAWLAVHRTLGLGIGAVFVLMGLTGSALVFHEAIDAWLNPALLAPRTRGEPRPLDEILTAARTALPEARGDVGMAMPKSDDEVFSVYFYDVPGAGSRPRTVEVTVDPASGAVLGQRDARRHLTAVLYGLHDSFMIGDAFGIREVGMTAVGIGGLVLTISTVSGLYLWWPRWAQFGRAVRVEHRHGGKRLTFDLHRAVGFWSALVLLVVAGTGVYLVFPNAVGAVVGAVSRTQPRPRGVASKPIPGAPLSAERVVQIVGTRFPGGVITWLDLPADPRAAYRAWVRQSRDVRPSDGDATVWVDQWSGAILHVRDRRTMPAGEAFLHWQFPLHNGEALGLAGRITVFLAGLTPLVLAVTGALIWWRKRRGRRAIAARRAAAR
jgi:uncharacterized iron-regulated membrane protein